METICDRLLLDHQHCDALFMRATGAVIDRNWQDGETSFCLFAAALERHMSMEEGILFPAFEQAFRHPEGPLAILRNEHGEIRGMVDRMSGSIAHRDAVEFLIHAETYTLLLQQHEMKEGQMLYPLLDKVLHLSAKRQQILHAMNTFREPGARV
ncbi:hypothetical protein GCM10027343_03550 [Noviherbaspirillum agri]